MQATVVDQSLSIVAESAAANLSRMEEAEMHCINLPEEFLLLFGRKR